MKKRFKIADREIGDGCPPFVIAELSGNHNGDIKRALKIIDEAKYAGADAIKLQTYTADTMTIDHDGEGFLVDVSLWKGKSLYDLYSEASTPWDWHEQLFAHAKKRDIIIFSTPFDFESARFLNDLGAPAFKIASAEMVDIPLIEFVASFRKPLIISTGMATKDEISDAVNAARGAGCEDLIMLHCVSAYPAPPEASHLLNIKALADEFGVISGLSDHSLGVSIAGAAVALGADVIEKHFTLDRNDGGVDSGFSLEPKELRQLVETSREVRLAVGRAKFGPKEAEIPGLKYRRSLYVVKDVPLGHQLTADNIRSIRPGLGLPPKHLHEVLGTSASRDLFRGEPLNWDMISGF